MMRWWPWSRRWRPVVNEQAESARKLAESRARLAKSQAQLARDRARVVTPLRHGQYRNNVTELARQLVRTERGPGGRSPAAG